MYSVQKMDNCDFKAAVEKVKQELGGWSETKQNDGSGKWRRRRRRPFLIPLLDLEIGNSVRKMDRTCGIMRI